MVTVVTLSFMRTQIKVFNPLQHVQNFTTLQYTPLPLLKKKTSSPWPLMAIPLALLPQDLASASPQYPGLSELSIPTSPAPLEVIPLSFPLEINMLFYHKLLLAELPMLLRSPNISIQLSPTVKNWSTKNLMRNQDIAGASEGDANVPWFWLYGRTRLQLVCCTHR